VCSFSLCLCTPTITIIKVTAAKTAAREQMSPVKTRDVHIVINERRIKGKKVKAGNEVTVSFYFSTQGGRITRNSRRVNDNGKSLRKSDDLF
jgi:hypothetical protein